MTPEGWWAQNERINTQASVLIFLICQVRVRAIYEWPKSLLQQKTTDITAHRCFMTESLIHQPSVPKRCDHLVLLQWRVSVTRCACTHTQCIASACAVMQGGKTNTQQLSHLSISGCDRVSEASLKVKGQSGSPWPAEGFRSLPSQPWLTT